MASPPATEGPVLSLRAHLINWLLTPLFVLWLFSTIAGYVATLNYANKPYDEVLLQRAQAVGAQLHLGGGKERLDLDLKLPDGSLPTDPDKVFYTVSDRDGKKLAGNASLGRPLSLRGGRIGPLFSNGERDGQKTRAVSLVFYNPDSKTVYQLHMSETIHQRQALIRGILANIVIPQLLLIMIAVAAIWYALKQGLAPLERLRNEVLKRKRDDLSRIDGSEAPEEVHPLIDAVNDLLEQLRQMIAAQQRFVADAAHQLRTPLAGLRTQVELALREEDTERKQRMLEHALTSAQRSSHLVNQLLMLARNEPGGQGISAFSTLDLDQLARDRTLHSVPDALAKDIDLGFEGTPDALVYGDADSLGEMLSNLIDNAIRYTQAGGHITVSVKRDPQGTTLQVEDNGPGIPEDQRELVLQRFYRILGSGQSGSGLGLAIASEVAKRHGTELELGAGEGGAGTRVSIRFPLPAGPAPD